MDYGIIPVATPLSIVPLPHHPLCIANITAPIHWGHVLPSVAPFARLLHRPTIGTGKTGLYDHARALRVVWSLETQHVNWTLATATITIPKVHLITKDVPQNPFPIVATCCTMLIPLHLFLWFSPLNVSHPSNVSTLKTPLDLATHVPCTPCPPNPPTWMTTITPITKAL
jgi:hypothetical protein